jgi:hypothetical protein
MTKVIDLSDPQALLDYAIFQALLGVYPEARPIHATVFICAGDGGYTFREAAAETGETEATLRAAFNELGELGLVQLTPELELTEEGDKLLDVALATTHELLSASAQH